MHKVKRVTLKRRARLESRIGEKAPLEQGRQRQQERKTRLSMALERLSASLLRKIRYLSKALLPHGF